MTAESTSPPGSVFYERYRLAGTSRFAVRAYRSDEFADGTVFDISADARVSTLGILLGTIHLDHARRPRVALTEDALPGATPLWFVQVPCGEDARPQMSLAAFASNHFAAGTIVTNDTFFSTPAHSSEQVGAVRWWAESGLVDQIFVREDLRHHLVAMTLMFTADALHHHHGWPGQIHVGGNRTDLGQRAAVAAPNQQRVAPWSQRSMLRPNP